MWTKNHMMTVGYIEECNFTNFIKKNYTQNWNHIPPNPPLSQKISVVPHFVRLFYYSTILLFEGILSQMTRLNFELYVLIMWYIWVLTDKWNFVMQHCTALLDRLFQVLKYVIVSGYFEYKRPGLIRWIKTTYICIDCCVTMIAYEWMDIGR